MSDPVERLNEPSKLVRADRTHRIRSDRSEMTPAESGAEPPNQEPTPQAQHAAPVSETDAREFLGPFRRAFWVATTAVCLFTSCSDSSGLATPIQIPVALIIVSGDQQVVTVGEELPEILVVRVVDDADEPVAGQIVNFRVTEGGGEVFAGVATTNDAGEARERWTLGTVAGELQEVEARAVDTQTGEALVFGTFTAEAVVGPAVQLQAATTAAQSATVGTAVATAPSVLATDQYANPVSGVAVTFAVASGGGVVDPTTAVLTDANGIAAMTSWTLGTTVGENTLTATSAGLSGSQVTFTATGTGPPAVATVVVTPASALLVSLEETVQLSANALDASGNTLLGKTFAWSSSDESVATVDATGLVTAVANGSATITATTDEISDNADLTVAQAVAGVAITPNSATLVSLGETVQLEASAKDANDNTISGKTFTWSSSDESIVTVNPSGLVTGIASGSVTIMSTTDGVTGEASVVNYGGLSGGVVLFSGVLRDRGGTPVPGQTIRLLEDASQHKNSTTDITAADGSFSLRVSPGTHVLEVYDGVDAANVPSDFSLSGPRVDLNGDLTQDLSLQNVFVDVTVRDPLGDPVSNAAVNVACIATTFDLFAGGSTRGTSCTRDAVTDGAGVVRLILFPTRSGAGPEYASVTVTPPVGSRLRQTVWTRIFLTDTRLNITLLCCN